MNLTIVNHLLRSNDVSDMRHILRLTRETHVKDILHHLLTILFNDSQENAYCRSHVSLNKAIHHFENGPFFAPVKTSITKALERYHLQSALQRKQNEFWQKVIT